MHITNLEMLEGQQNDQIRQFIVENGKSVAKPGYSSQNLLPNRHLGIWEYEMRKILPRPHDSFQLLGFVNKGAQF